MEFSTLKIKKIIAICLVLINCTVFSLPTAKLTIRVIDENGKVVPNANIGIGFYKPKIEGLGSDETGIDGTTNSEGLFTASGSTEPYLGFRIEKQGYYKTMGSFKAFKGTSGVYGFRKWKPWNSTIDVVLKKIINPIPMYVAHITGNIYSDDPPATLPDEGNFFGYDLIAKDWVVPNGQGLHSDFIFKIDVAHYNGTDDYDASMTLKFTNPDDGILSFFTPNNRSSDLRSSHNAPLENYKNKLVIRLAREKDKIANNPFRDDQNYYFRVRTKRDEQGNIIEAHYGKIYGNIKYYIPNKDNKGKVFFSYYLNPNNNDTNVENSPERNLFPKPKDYSGSYRFKP